MVIIIIVIIIHIIVQSLLWSIYIYNQDVNDSQSGCIFSFPILSGKERQNSMCVFHVFAVLEVSSKVSWPFHQEEIFTSDPGTFHEAPHSWEVAFHALSGENGEAVALLKITVANWPNLALGKIVVGLYVFLFGYSKNTRLSVSFMYFFHAFGFMSWHGLKSPWFN